MTSSSSSSSSSSSAAAAAASLCQCFSGEGRRGVCGKAEEGGGGYQ